jgi:hypothetical protein
MKMEARESSVLAGCVRNQVVRFSGADKPAKESRLGFKVSLEPVTLVA